MKDPYEEKKSSIFFNLLPSKIVENTYSYHV